jgi:hypothetical protein
MSIDEADEIMNTYEKWDKRHARQDFINRMERKLHRKERLSYR